jgi:hypothetical protein
MGPFPQRLLRDQHAQPGDQIRAAAEQEPGISPGFLGRHTPLSYVGQDRGALTTQRDIRTRLAPPQRQCVSQQLGRPRRIPAG